MGQAHTAFTQRPGRSPPACPASCQHNPAQKMPRKRKYGFGRPKAKQGSNVGSCSALGQAVGAPHGRWPLTAGRGKGQLLGTPGGQVFPTLGGSCPIPSCQLLGAGGSCQWYPWGSLWTSGSGQPPRPSVRFARTRAPAPICLLVAAADFPLSLDLMHPAPARGAPSQGHRLPAHPLPGAFRSLPHNPTPSHRSLPRQPVPNPHQHARLSAHPTLI